MTSKNLLRDNLIERSVLYKQIGGRISSIKLFLPMHRHRASCLMSPHTSTKSVCKCKHQHIVEMGITMLSHASMPLKFWDKAFVIVVFLINCLPSKIINDQTPFERLYGNPLQYTFLRTFGCVVWPNLRPYNSKKLEF